MSFCQEKLIDLEVRVVFDILYNNSIIIERDRTFAFRAIYWIYYFAAKRMHANQEFCDYIFSNKIYTSAPEIIEFYTGIDRNRNDALKILTEDISETCDIVENKVGLSNDFDPYRHVEWKPTQVKIDKMKKEVSEDILNSKLPDDVKDQYADNSYNQLKPYNQSIQTLFEEYSLQILIQKIKACSRALRNSDYAEPDIKRTLLFEITRSWSQISKVLFTLTPILAMVGHANFEGINFYLASSFGDTIEEKVKRIHRAVPINVVSFFKNDLYSKKIGPLLFDKIKNENDQLLKHKLILLLIQFRPKDWRSVVENYIISTPKNSFYLYSVVRTLNNRYKFAFLTESELREIGFLIKKGIAKHETGIKNPGIKNVLKISNKVLPKRDDDLIE